jgi:hypothetical protein
MAKVATEIDLRPARNEERYARLEGVLDNLRLEAMPCGFCNSIGTLTRTWPDGNDECPRCKRHTLDLVSSYIT